jgi:uncharacterized protein (TIGR02466 family)
MAETEMLFVTRLYRAELPGGGKRGLLIGLEQACAALVAGDAAGHKWCEANGYPGYTSYASLTDLPSRFPEFADLAKVLDEHAHAFAKELDFDLGGKALHLDSLWVNVLPEGGYHTQHLHPHSVISGTFYVQVPKGAAALKFEDPRLALMMAAPPKRAKAARENRIFVSIEPKAGTLLLWESFLRHEVPVNASRQDRISISFNYRWG